MDRLWQQWGAGLFDAGVPALAAAVIALVLVAHGGAWRVSRNVVTIAHEGGHALLALLSGRKLTGIRLHSDTSGLTVSTGRSSGPGMVLTLFAGYTAVPLLGLGGAALVTTGRVRLMLWLAIGLLALMLLAIRNAYGVLSVVLTGGIVFLVSWQAAPEVQVWCAALFSWFLLLGGIRPLAELRRKRRAGRARDSDADQLARLTGLPAALWLAAWFVLGLLALVAGGRWLLFAAQL